MTAKHNAALGFIFITVLIDVIGIGIILPVLPGLVRQMAGGDIGNAATYGSWLSFAYAITQFVCSPVMGALSDRYGRRPVLLFSLLGLGADYIFQALAPTLTLLFVGRILSGVAGASITTANAYIADISKPGQRAQHFGMIGLALGLGYIIGPGIGGLCSEWGKHISTPGNFNWSLRLPFIVAAAISLLNLVYGFFLLPESLAPENRRSFNWRHANPVSGLLRFRKYPAVSKFITSYTIIFIAGQALIASWTYYTIYKFKWTSIDLGLSLSLIGIILSIVQGLLIRIIIPKLGEKNAVYTGLLLSASGLICFAFASEGWMMYVFLLPYCLGSICTPALQSMLSRQVPAGEQGSLQGALASLASVSTFIGPLIMNNLFAFFISDKAPFRFAGMPFLLGAILMLTAVFFLKFTRPETGKNS